METKLEGRQEDFTRELKLLNIEFASSSMSVDEYNNRLEILKLNYEDVIRFQELNKTSTNALAEAQKQVNETMKTATGLINLQTK